MCSVCSHSVEFSCITFPINCFDFRASAVALRGNTHRDTHTKCTCVYSSASKRTLKISASFVEFALFTLRFKLALKLRIYKIRIIRRHWTRKRESETRAENGKRDNFFLLLPFTCARWCTNEKCIIFSTPIGSYLSRSRHILHTLCILVVIGTHTTWAAAVATTPDCNNSKNTHSKDNNTHYSYMLQICCAIYIIPRWHTASLLSSSSPSSSNCVPLDVAHMNVFLHCWRCLWLEASSLRHDYDYDFIND